MDKTLRKISAGLIVIDSERCKGCGLCIDACPKKLIAIACNKVNSHGYQYAECYDDSDACIGCASCGIICPDGCITVYKEGTTKKRIVSQESNVETTTIACCCEDAADKTPVGEPQSADAILLKGNEALALAAIRTGVDGYFGYPITPQSEILETLASERPWETTGMVVLQTESEVASINMLYGGAGAGKKVFTSSSSIGIALMQEGISYCAGAELPVVVVNVQRGGPGLGTIQPSQGDYFQATRGGGNGDYNTIVLAPASVQEMADFVDVAFSLAFRYRNPVMILSDGLIGQMMEPVVLPPYRPRRTQEEIERDCPWATTGKKQSRQPNIITSLELQPEQMESHNLKLQHKYKVIRETETLCETTCCEDAEYLIVAFGSAARIATDAINELRDEGVNVGLFRPITLWPYPEKELRDAAQGKRGVLVVEINAGQMVQDVRLSLGNSIPISHYGRFGGMVPEPQEIVNTVKQFVKKDA